MQIFLRCPTNDLLAKEKKQILVQTSIQNHIVLLASCHISLFFFNLEASYSLFHDFDIFED